MSGTMNPSTNGSSNKPLGGSPDSDVAFLLTLCRFDMLELTLGCSAPPVSLERAIAVTAPAIEAAMSTMPRSALAQKRRVLSIPAPYVPSQPYILQTHTHHRNVVVGSPRRFQVCITSSSVSACLADRVA